MIQYSLRCAEDHRFDSWFQSASAFDKLHAAGMVTCAVCGTTEVEKDLMAPRVNAQTARPEAEAAPALSGPASPAEQALRALREQVEKNSEYVGRDFAAQARAMHEGDVPQRAIWGETRGDEAIPEGTGVAVEFDPATAMFFDAKTEARLR